MKAYYDRRAPEYDEWYEGLGRFDALGRPRWDYFAPEGLLRERGGGRILYAGRWFVAVEA